MRFITSSSSDQYRGTRREGLSYDVLPLDERISFNAVRQAQPSHLGAVREWLSGRLQNDLRRFESGQCLVNFKEMLCTVLGILAVVAVFGLLIGGAYFTAHQNMLKQEKMTQYCVTHGYRGWDDSSSRNESGASSCVRD
jgi:hypothetical protein